MSSSSDDTAVRRYIEIMNKLDIVAECRSDRTMLATGKPYRNDYIARFSVRDGRLTQVAEWFDPIVFLQAQDA